LGKEWLSYRLEGLPEAHSSILATLTERRLEGEGTKMAVYVADISKRIRYWQKFLIQEYPLLTRAAVRLLPLHVTTCSCERNWSVWGSVYTKARNRLAIERAEKLIYIRCNSTTPSKKNDEEILLEVLAEDGE
jgi:hypothetical protein